MPNKNMLSSSLPVIRDIPQERSILPEDATRSRWFDVLQRLWGYLKGANEEKAGAPDPAAAIILQIEDKEVAQIVRELHYRTPRSLQAMRRACEQCFVLPDDCPYYDYSIFDVKKAWRRLAGRPRQTHEQVVLELQKINRELADHIAEYLG